MENKYEELTLTELEKSIGEENVELVRLEKEIEKLKAKAAKGEEISDLELRKSKDLNDEASNCKFKINKMVEVQTQKMLENKERAKQILNFAKETQNTKEEVQNKMSNAVDNESQKYAIDFTKAMIEGEEALNKFVAETHGVKNFTKVLGTSDQGGMDDFSAIIPTYISNTIESQMEYYGNLIQHCQVETVNGIRQLLIETLATPAEWHDENTPENNEEEITIEGVPINPRMVKKHISVTDELMYSTGMELMSYIQNEFIRKILVFVEEQIVNGQFQNGKGLLGLATEANTPTVADPNNAGQSIYVKKDEAAAIAADTVANLMALIDGEDEVIFMNKKTYRANYQSLLDTTGRPIFGTNVNGQIEMQGVPVKFTSALKPFDAAAPGQPVVIAMAKNAYAVNAPNGMTPMFMVDPYTKMTEDKTRVLGKLFICGRPAKIEGAAVLFKKDVNPI